MAKNKYDIETLRRLREDWNPDAVNPDLMSEENRRKYLSRKKAVDMYIDGYKLSEIQSATAIKQISLYRDLERVTATNPENGFSFGYRALVSRFFVKGHEKEYGSRTTAGDFMLLLKRFPDAEDFLLSNYFNKSKSNIEHNVSIKSLHQSFLVWLRQHNVTDDEYPFNTNNLGYKSLCLYLKNASDKHIYSSSTRLRENAEQKVTSTGIGSVISYSPYAPYQCVQLDGHRLDVLYIVELTDPQTGEVFYDTAERPWLLTVIDVATRNIIGYSITQEAGYDSIDVLNAYKHAVLPKKLTELTYPGLEYPEAAFPDIAIPQLQYSLPSVLYMDNDSSHLSYLTRTKLLNTLGATLAYGAVTTPETRGIIERFFGKLESIGLHRLPSTTGSNPNDPKRKEAEKAAKKYHITFDVINQIIAWSIAWLNNEPHTALSGFTPIELMKARIEAGGMWPCRAEKDQIAEIEKLSHRNVTAIIRGSRRSGKRPYIQYKYVEYRSNRISSDFSLVGTEVVLEIDPEDIRYLKVYNAEDGVLIDTVHATGKWSYIPHTLQIREWANDYDTEYRKTYGRKCPDPIRSLLDHLLEESKKSVRARNRANIIIKASGGLLDDSQEAKAQKYEIITETPTDKEEIVAVSHDYSEAEPIDIVNMDVETISVDQLKKIDYKLLTNKQKSALLRRLGNDAFYELFGSEMA